MQSMKRKAQTPLNDVSEASRAQRKRVQNRISQKCHRERQAAHARHLESLVHVVKTGDQEGDNASADERYTALLRQHMKVIEEKHELEEAIFRMRKKLLSISNSAAAAADDEAVDALVRSKNPTKRQSEPDFPSPSPPANQTESNREKSPVNVEARSHHDIAPIRNVTIDQSEAGVSSQEPQSLDLANSHDTLISNRGSLLPSIIWIPESEPTDAIVDTVAGQLTPQDQNYALTFGALELNFPLDYSFSMPLPAKTLPTRPVIVTSAAAFTDSILHACRKCVGLRTSELDGSPMDSHELATYDWLKEAQDLSNVAKISAIGVRLLAAFAGLEPYIYGVGAASVMESLIRWRLMPTFANRVAVPEPFRPTPLQYSASDYPPVIDFFNWPDIRDQLILQSRTIDIDEVIREVAQNTVIEIPHRHVSVNVLSLFYSNTLNSGNHMAYNKLKTAVTDMQWKYLEVPVSPGLGFISPTVDPTPAESALVREISRLMDTGSNTSPPEENNQQSTIDTSSVPRGSYSPVVTNSLTGSWSAARQGGNDVVTRFGLDQLAKWKLSKEFARKHPFLDCSSAVAAYDMVSSQGL